MELLKEFFINFWILSNDMAVYILIGVLFAGVLKQVIPEDFVSRHLGKDTFGSVIKSSLFGIPLPLCSCSVIPFATSLKKEGASSGSVLSFLISTPITGADSILATYGFFGWIFTIYRVVTSLVIAIVAGILQNLLGKVPAEATEEENYRTCGCGDSCSMETQGKRFSMKKALDYAVFDIFKDFAKPLFWGLVLGALITTFMPKDIMQYLGDNLLLTYLLILLFSMPLYICATASLPIAASLIASGLSGGAAFILLSAGPATNSVTMGVVLKTLGKKALIIYLGVIGLFSLLFGYFFDLFFPAILSAQMTEHIEAFGLVAQLSAVMMLALMLYFLIAPKLKKKTTKETIMKNNSAFATAPAKKEKTKKVLVLCTGNSCRSIIAEALINKELDGIEAYSSGVAPSGRVNPNAKKVLESHGAWNNAYHSKTLDEVMVHDFDLVVTVCDHAKETCPLFPKPVEKIHVGFEDPDGKGYEAFEETYEEIRTTLLPKLREIFNEKKKEGKMEKNVFKTAKGAKIAFTGAVAKQQIITMVENCSTGNCECMSDETREKISNIEVDGEDGNVELKLTGDVSKEELEAALERSKVLNDK